MKRNLLHVVLFISLASLAVALDAVSTDVAPKNPEAWLELEPQACLPTAIVMSAALNKAGCWSKVFTYRSVNKYGKHGGHAMVAYMFPANSGKLWTYDATGSTRIVGPLVYSIKEIVRISNEKRGYKYLSVSGEKYLD